VQKELLTRRAFFNSVTSTASKSFLVLSMPAILAACREAQRARLSGADFTTLTEEEANEFDAIAARILPTTSTPGAREAGVVYFMDNVLGDNREEELAQINEGLRELQTTAALEHDAAYFHVLDEAQQDQLLTSIANTDFFYTMRYLTIAGMFALPEYGGNRDFVGYQLIGFEDQRAWGSPYGFYDADFAERGE
jgi:gluconate 2-dehydrogenase gamma chain